MIDVGKVVTAICGKFPNGAPFRPSEINLTDYFVEAVEEEEEGQDSVALEELEEAVEAVLFVPRYPFEENVIAIDSSSMTLGYVPDGIVGAVRLSVVIKPPGKTARRLQRYGPYLTLITNQNKDALYRSLFRTVHGSSTDSSAPNCDWTLGHVRSLLERYIQFEVVRSYRENLILLDGSLIGGTVGDPMFVLRKIIDSATGNRNCLVAISKHTRLTLQSSRRSILSLLDGACGPCCVGGVKDRISQNRDRYLGDIYVAKLTPLGEPFRIDIPSNAPVPHEVVLSKVAGLAGDYGYPEELKLAHMTCELSSLEVIELQAAAIRLFGLRLGEDIRRRIFPL